jgi:hypothetical protein
MQMNQDVMIVNDDEKGRVPLSAAARIKELLSLPVKNKETFLPLVGQMIRLGPFIFKVTVTNPSQLRFTASLADVVIEGVNDGEGKEVVTG